MEFDQNKFEIIKDDVYSDIAKIDVDEDLELVTADTQGNFIINTVNGKKEKNQFDLTFRVKENVNLKKEKITLKIIDSNIDIGEKDIYLVVGKQKIERVYFIFIPIVILMILGIIKITKREGRKR